MAAKPEIPDWQIAGRGAGWWFTLIALGVLFGIMAWLKSQS